MKLTETWDPGSHGPRYSAVEIDYITFLYYTSTVPHIILYFVLLIDRRGPWILIRSSKSPNIFHKACNGVNTNSCCVCGCRFAFRWHCLQFFRKETSKICVAYELTFERYTHSHVAVWNIPTGRRNVVARRKRWRDRHKLSRSNPWWLIHCCCCWWWRWQTSFSFLTVFLDRRQVLFVLILCWAT
jgi:hypothetical protein